MIPNELITSVRGFAARNLVRILIAVAVLIAVWWLVASLTSGKSAKVEARLGANQVEAATESGADAVETIGKQMAAEGTHDTITRENDDAIRNAEGADAPVAPAVRDAGRRSLCRRAAYRGDSKCLQQPAPE